MFFITAMFKPGDYIYSFYDGKYQLAKVLVIEEFDTPDGVHYIQHCMTFKASKTKPTKDNIDTFEVYIMHSPFTLNEAEYTFVTNRPVTKEELGGYRVYKEHAC